MERGRKKERTKEETQWREDGARVESESYARASARMPAESTLARHRCRVVEDVVGTGAQAARMKGEHAPSQPLPAWIA